MKKKILSALILVSMFSLVGCGEEKKADSKNNNTLASAGESDSKSEKEEKGEKEETEQKTNQAFGETKLGEVSLNIYTVDVQTDEVKNLNPVKTKDLTIKENLNKIAESLSKEVFADAKIEVVSIDEVKKDNDSTKSVAVINLVD